MRTVSCGPATHAFPAFGIVSRASRLPERFFAIRTARKVRRPDQGRDRVSGRAGLRNGRAVNRHPEQEPGYTLAGACGRT